MKKAVSIMLAFLLCFSFSASAMAVSESTVQLYKANESTARLYKKGTTVSLDKNIDHEPIHASLTLNGRQAAASASFVKDPADYNIAQTQILLFEYTMTNDSNGYKQTDSITTLWNTGKTECSAFSPYGWTMTCATSYNQYNINGITYIGAGYMLNAAAE